MTKEETVSEETPRKRRPRAAPEPEVPVKKAALKRKAKADEVEAPAKKAPKRKAKAEEPVEAPAKAARPAPEPDRDIPATREPAPRPSAPAPESAPREPTVRAPEVRAESPREAAAPPIERASPPGDSAGANGQQNPVATTPSGGQPHGQHPRHPRHERHRNRHGGPNGGPPGNPGGQGGQPHGGQPQGGQPQGGPTQAGPQQGGQQHQPGQPGLPGQGRRRRRRGRGGGGGGGGQPGQPGGHPQHVPQEVQLQPFTGYLELDDRGFGRLRRMEKNFAAAENDPDVPKQMVDRYRLRPGALVQAGFMMRNGKPTVARVDTVEGVPPEEAANRLAFMNLTSVDPDRRIVLETTSTELLTRVVDVIAPIGFGQRGLIVAPPKTGKTIILQKIAKSVLTNHPAAKLMVLLIDERPEEVTDFRRSIGADVYASSSDRPAHEHLRMAEMVMERARRHVEAGDDVVVLLDSITRLARAYNKEIESSGRTMSGGVDSRALERPKRLFGAARNTEEAGSLTILGTALIDTGSRMDEVIFEEFKGTGNMEIVLDRALAERRLWPAINVNNSGTRKEEKLFSVREAEKNRKLRAYLSALRPVEAMEKLLSRIRDFRSNGEFYDAL